MNSSLSPVILIGTILTGTLFFSPNASAAESADKVLFYKKPAQNWEQETDGWALLFSEEFPMNGFF